MKNFVVKQTFTKAAGDFIYMKFEALGIIEKNNNSPLKAWEKLPKFRKSFLETYAC